MKKLFELTKTQLLQIPRNRSLLFGTIAFPLIFIGVFGLAMNQGVQGNYTMNIGILSGDAGIPDSATVFGMNGTTVDGVAYQDLLIQVISDLKYDDNETSVFNVNYYNLDQDEQALEDIQKSSISALMILPEDFSLGVMAVLRANFETSVNMTFATNNWALYPSIDYTSDIEIKGDPTVQDFNVAASVLSSILDQFFKLGENSVNGHQAILSTDIAIEDFTIFDYVLPGLVIFGLLQNLGTVAVSSMRDVESGLLRRLRISQMTGTEYTMSLILSQLTISVVQIPIFFGVASMFGFPITSSIVYAFIFAMLISLSVTGLGLIVASFGKSQDSVSTIATMVAVPMAFLAGSFFEVPNIVLFENVMDGNTFGLFDLISAKPAIEGLRLILVGGRSLVDVRYQFLLLTGLTFMYLAAGIFFYSRRHLRPED